MPLYDYRCRQCDERFEVRLDLDALGQSVPCPVGHTDTVRLFTPIAVTGRSSSAPVASPAPAGPCGAGCGCFHGG